MRIGFLGLGIMGCPMALNLVRHGNEVWIDSASSRADELIRAGAVSSSRAGIGRNCSLIFTMLPSGTIVKDVLFGERGIASLLSPGTIVCDCSSISPVEAREIAERLNGRDVFFFDAPVSGGEPKAIDGTLSIMAGGDATQFEALKPFLLQMGSSAVLVGKNGSGSVSKLANQIIVNVTIAAVAEGLTIADRAGVDPAKVVEAIRGGLAGSEVLEQKAPKMLAGNFAPGGKLSIIQKDLRNITGTAGALDLDLPFSEKLLAVVDELVEEGYADDDHAAIIRYYRKGA